MAPVVLLSKAAKLGEDQDQTWMPSSPMPRVPGLRLWPHTFQGLEPSRIDREGTPKHPPAPSGISLTVIANKEQGPSRFRPSPCFNWWSHAGSNRGPLQCHWLSEPTPWYPIPSNCMIRLRFLDLESSLSYAKSAYSWLPIGSHRVARNGWMISKLTKRTVDALVSDGDEVRIWDSELRGFGVRCRASGDKYYFLKYRLPNGRQRWATIGRHGSAWTVELARKEARRSACRLS